MGFLSPLTAAPVSVEKALVDLPVNLLIIFEFCQEPSGSNVRV